MEKDLRRERWWGEIKGRRQGWKVEKEQSGELRRERWRGGNMVVCYILQ